MNWFSSAAVSAMVLAFASGATAATQNIIYTGQGTPIVDDSLGIDIVGGGADLNEADGINDLNLTENPSPGDTSGRFGVDSRFVGSVNGFSIFQSADLARNAANELILFSDGDEIDDSDFLGSQDTAILYGGSGLSGFPEAPDGILPNVGDSVVLGFRFQFIAEPIFEYEEELFLTDIASTDRIYCEEIDEDCVIGGQEEVVATYFGFMEITRGSVVPGILGFNNVSGQAAIVSLPNTGNPSAVPLPAAGWMLVAALGGMGIAARRKKS